jgi:hypothetical protein
MYLCGIPILSEQAGSTRWYSTQCSAEFLCLVLSVPSNSVSGRLVAASQIYCGESDLVSFAFHFYSEVSFP